MKKSEFKKAKTIPEVTLIAKRLKEEGEDINEINRLAYLRKKELMTKVNKVDNLQKVLPRASSKAVHKISHIRFSGNNMSSKNMTIYQDCHIEL